MKLTKTQQELFDKAKRTIDVFRKYKTYEEFFDNSKYEQGYMSTGANLNSAYRTSELAKQRYTKEEWEENRLNFEKCKNEGILLINSKTESIEKLEKLGLIKIIKKATWSKGSDLIQVLNY